MDTQNIERMIIKASLSSKDFISNISTVFEDRYMEDVVRAEIYGFISKYYIQYREIPPRHLIESNVKNCKEELDNIDCIDVNVSRHYDYIFDKTNEYLKEQSLKKAIIESVNIITKKEEFARVKSLIDEALSKDLKVNIGLDYFGTISERLKRIFTEKVVRVPTYYTTVDEYLSGGFPPHTLTVFAAAIHGGKSQLLSNFIRRQVLNNHNVLLASMEMSEDEFARRFDALFTNKDINRLYTVNELKTNLVKTLSSIKNNVGKLIIKQFPTGNTSVIDIRSWVRECIIRGINPSILYADYINLMKPSYKSKGDLYSDVKKISEELRAISSEFNIPVVSVTQLNREGMYTNFSELDFTFVSESIAVAATVDAFFVLGSDEDSQVYKSELLFKPSKNRIGGRVGEIGKFYSDMRSLRLYDATELDQWLEDAKESGDEREVLMSKEDNKKKKR